MTASKRALAAAVARRASRGLPSPAASAAAASALPQAAPPQPLPATMPFAGLGLDLGAASPLRAATSQAVWQDSEPVWHLARRLHDHGHLLNVGVHVTALVAEHGVAATPASIDDALREAAASAPAVPKSGFGPGGGAAPLPSALPGGGPANASSAGEAGAGRKFVPLDYWSTYDSRMRVFN